MNCIRSIWARKKRQFLPIFEESELLNIEIDTTLKQLLISNLRLQMWQIKVIMTLLVGLGKSILKELFWVVIGFTTRIY
jgi:hypothetical protein